MIRGPHQETVIKALEGKTTSGETYTVVVSKSGKVFKVDSIHIGPKSVSFDANAEFSSELEASQAAKDELIAEGYLKQA